MMRIRRHMAPLISWRWRRLSWPIPRGAGLTYASIFVGALLVGYAIAALVLFPAPIFASHKSVPRVVGLAAPAAREAISVAGLKAQDAEQIRHPTAPAGDVVWQDPPAEMMVPEGTIVQLSISTGPPRVPVPDVSGYDGRIAQSLIEASGLRVGTIDSAQTPAPKGVVVNSRPPAGTPLVPGAKLTLVVSAGAPTITVPNLQGLTLEDARAVLEQAGLTLGTNFRRTSAAQPGTIIEQRPASGTLSSPGTAVDVVLARRGVQ